MDDHKPMDSDLKKMPTNDFSLHNGYVTKSCILKGGFASTSGQSENSAQKSRDGDCNAVTPMETKTVSHKDRLRCSDPLPQGAPDFVQTPDAKFGSSFESIIEKLKICQSLSEKRDETDAVHTAKYPELARLLNDHKKGKFGVENSDAFSAPKNSSQHFEETASVDVSFTNNLLKLIEAASSDQPGFSVQLKSNEIASSTAAKINERSVDDLVDDFNLKIDQTLNLKNSAADQRTDSIQILTYENETQIADIMRLITRDLSEPYSIYTYRYFIYNWPHLCYLAKSGETYVGAIVCKLALHGRNIRRGYIAMLAVDENFRRLKIGTKLVTRAIDAMTSEGCDEVVLETEITNKSAMKLYENLGFVRDKRLFRYYLNGVDAFRLKLWLRPPEILQYL